MPRKTTKTKQTAKKAAKKPAPKKPVKDIGLPDIFALTPEQQAIHKQLAEHIDPAKNPVAFLELVKVKSLADKAYKEVEHDGITIFAQNSVVMQHPSYKAYADCLTKMIRLYTVLGVKGKKLPGKGKPNFDLD